jgi:hypothetical protein
MVSDLAVFCLGKLILGIFRREAEISKNLGVRRQNADGIRSKEEQNFIQIIKFDLKGLCFSDLD